MNLQLGISIYSVLGHSVDKLLRFVEENHFEAIELWDSCLNYADKNLLKHIEDENRVLSIHTPLLDLGKERLLRENITSLSETINLANSHNAKVIVQHTGIIDNASSSERLKSIETAKIVISANIDSLKENGVCLCIENVGCLGNDLIINFEDLATFVDALSCSSVGVAFDVAHANVAGGIENGIDILGSRIKHIHISDNIGKTDGHHRPLGKGNIDFNLLKQNLKADLMVAIMEIEPDFNWKKNLLDSRKVLRGMGLI